MAGIRQNKPISFVGGIKTKKCVKEVTKSKREISKTPQKWGMSLFFVSSNIQSLVSCWDPCELTCRPFLRQRGRSLWTAGDPRPVTQATRWFHESARVLKHFSENKTACPKEDIKKNLDLIFAAITHFHNPHFRKRLFETKQTNRYSKKKWPTNKQKIKQTENDPTNFPTKTDQQTACPHRWVPLVWPRPPGSHAPRWPWLFFGCDLWKKQIEKHGLSIGFYKSNPLMNTLAL